MAYIYKLITVIFTQNYHSNIIYKTQNDLAKHCKTRVDYLVNLSVEYCYIEIVPLK